MEIDGITEEVSVTDCDLSRSVFRDVRLDDTVFDDVSFARAKFFFTSVITAVTVSPVMTKGTNTTNSSMRPTPSPPNARS